jgi:hypothetical protein
MTTYPPQPPRGMATINTRLYAHGTELTQSHPWGFYLSGRAMCADGIVRAVRLASTANTFYSVPASVQVRGKTVSGYITVETAHGYSTETDDDPAVIKFGATYYGRNAEMLPAGLWRL